MLKMLKYLPLFFLGFLAFTEPSDSIDIDCDFEQDFCNWSVNDKDKFKRWNGKGPHYGTGPLFGDHTTGEGYYALCDGTLLKDPTDTCEVSTTLTNNEDVLKLSFWYYYNGKNLQSLKLMNESTILWGTSSQRNAWLSGQVYLPIGTYTLKFVGSRKEFNFGCDIAIDDIVVQRTGAKSTESSISNSEVYTVTPTKEISITSETPTTTKTSVVTTSPITTESPTTSYESITTVKPTTTNAVVATSSHTTKDTPITSGLPSTILLQSTIASQTAPVLLTTTAKVTTKDATMLTDTTEPRTSMPFVTEPSTIPTIVTTTSVEASTDISITTISKTTSEIGTTTVLSASSTISHPTSTISYPDKNSSNKSSLCLATTIANILLVYFAKLLL